MGLDMSSSRRKTSLIALAVLVPFAVFSGIMLSTDRSVSGSTSKRRAVGGSGRRLQSGTYDFATQLEMTVCLTEGHSSESATSSPDEFKNAIVDFFDIEETDYVAVSDTVSRCLVDNWQRRVSIYNLANESIGTAADVAAAQVDTIYPNSPETKTTNFFEAVATSINEQNPELDPEASDFDLESLGFLVIWLDSSGDVVNTQGTSEDKDVVSIGGTDVWWPWWAWLIYAGVVLLCICPMLFFFFKWRRDKEAETEGYNQGKDLGQPAPPSATSANPYGASYTGEEYKTSKN